MSGDAPLKAANVGRVSHDQTGTERSISEQQDDNRAECERLGWTITDTYSDAVSASRFAHAGRPDWLRLQDDITAGDLGAVVLWESSRGSREPEDWFAFLRRCRDTGTLIHVTTHSRTYDMRNPRDWKTLAEDGVTNAYASEETSLRVKRALAASARQGRPLGRPNYGFAREYALDPKTHRHVLAGQYPVPETIAVAVEIIRRIAGAEPVSAVRDDLNSRGVAAPHGGAWDRSQVRRIARSPAYIGKRRVGTDLVGGFWPGVVDEETWYAAQAVLDSPERKTTRPGKARWLLSYIATCGPCGEVVYAMGPTRGRRPYYWCSNVHSHCVAVGVAKADAFVRRVVVERCGQPDIYEHVVRGNDEGAAQARAEAAGLRERLTAHKRLAIAGRITPESFADIEAELRRMIGGAERRARELAVPVPLRGLVEPGADIGARWDAMYEGNIAACREVVRLLLAPVTVGRAVVDGARVRAEQRIRFPAWGDE